MIASEVKNTLSEFGILDPNNDSTPSAKAMSVAVGIAHPRHVSGLCQLMAKKISAGASIPPSAAMQGNARRGPAVEFPDEDFALDLEPDQQEEQRHQPVIDPMQDAEAGDFGMQQLGVVVGESRIGDNQAERGARHEHQAA